MIFIRWWTERGAFLIPGCALKVLKCRIHSFLPWILLWLIYEQGCPFLWHLRQVGFTPSHLIFRSLQREQATCLCSLVGDIIGSVEMLKGLNADAIRRGRNGTRYIYENMSLHRPLAIPQVWSLLPLLIHSRPPDRCMKLTLQPYASGTWTCGQPYRLQCVAWLMECSLRGRRTRQDL